jgi:hypothetical protein
MPLRKNRIAEMCADGAYERECFVIDPGQCRDLVARCFDECSKEHAKEISATAASTPTEIGTILGGCTEKRYIAELEKQGKIHREGRCADPSKFFR